MDSLINVLRNIYSPDCFAPSLKVLSQLTIPKLNNETILLLRNVIMINNKDLKQFSGLQVVVKIIQQSLNLDYTPNDWLTIGENFSCLIVALFESILLYQKTSHIKDAVLCNLILEAGKTMLPIVDQTDILRVSLNNDGYTCMLQMICLDDLDFLVRKEIFLLYKPIIIKSDSRQRKTIMNSSESFLSKMSAFILTCGDYEIQEAIVEILMRFSYASKQKLNKLYFWFRNYPNVLTGVRLLDYKNFDISCRKFLNSVNATINTDDKVLTLPCLEAYANDIQLQKPNSEEYKEFWVDFSLKTGTIHITCDSGANAWLRLLIENKNVKKSYFSSRLYKKNETEINGKQILFELISPLEIELHFKENLIMTVTLLFPESHQLVYLQTNFFDKWHRFSNNKEKYNHFEAVSKAFRASIHQRSKSNEKFFSGTSVSSLSSIRSCSTCSTKQCCQRTGHIRFRGPKGDVLPFSTSTPKENHIIHQEPSSNPDLRKKLCLGTGNAWSSPSTFVSLKSNVGGGIFNHGRLHEFQNPETKSSLAKGISIHEDKEEDGLFKKMMEESLKHGKTNRLDGSHQKNLDEGLNVREPEPFLDVKAASSSDSIRKVLFRGGMSGSNTENIQPGKKGCVDKKDSSTSNICGDNSEGSMFILSTHRNTINKLSSENISPSEVGTTSDEASTKSVHKKVNLFDPKKKIGNSPKNPKSRLISEKPVIPSNDDVDTVSQVTAKNEKTSYATPKKPVLQSPYFKLFNSNNSSSSVHIDKILTDDTKKNQTEEHIIKKNNESSNTIFKLKPPVLNIDNINKNKLTSHLKNNFSFYSSIKVDTFQNSNEKSATKQDNEPKTNSFQNDELGKESDKEKITHNKVKQPKDKNIKKLSITKNIIKRKCDIKPENLRNVKKKRDDFQSKDVMLTVSNTIYAENSNMITDKCTKETDMVEASDKKQSESYFNGSNSSAKLTKEDFTGLLFNKQQNDTGSESNKNSTFINRNSCSLNKSVQKKENHEDHDQGNILDDIYSQRSCGAITNTSYHSEKTSDCYNNISKFNNCSEEKTSKEVRRLGKRRSIFSTGNSSSLPNTTISSQQSIHCSAIPGKTYSIKPTNVKLPTTPDKIFDNLKRQTERKDGLKKSEKMTHSINRKRKLFTPNSSFEEMSPYKAGEDSALPIDILAKDNPPENAKERKSKQTLNPAFKQPKKEKSLKSQKSSPLDIFNFSDSNHSFNGEEEGKRKTRERKSLRTRAVKSYKEVSSDESFNHWDGNDNKKRKNVPKEKSSTDKTGGFLTLPSEKFSVSEKVSKFMMSINESRDKGDVVREEELESEMELRETPVVENWSDISPLEAVKPPLWLSAGDINIPSPHINEDSNSDVSLTAPTQLNLRDDPKKISNEIDFLQSVIKNIECLSLSVKRKPPKINTQEKLVRTVESFSSSNIEEMNMKWTETRKSLEQMLSNLDDLSGSCKTFMMSFEKRMKDMIESSISEFNAGRTNTNKQSENLCKELKKMCYERHKLLKKQ